MRNFLITFLLCAYKLAHAFTVHINIIKFVLDLNLTNGPGNILVHPRRTINNNDADVSPAQEELPDKDSTVIPQS